MSFIPKRSKNSLLELAKSKREDLIIGNELVGTYYKDYDLNYAHIILKKALKRHLNRAEAAPAVISDLQEQIAKTKNRITIKSLEDKISEQNFLIANSIELQKIYNDHILRLLKNYNECPPPSAYDQKFGEVHSDYDDIRIIIIEEWLNWAKNFLTVNVIRTKQEMDYCDTCYSNFVTIDDEKMCPSCGVVYKINDTSKNEHPTTLKRKNNDSISNLKKIFYRMQGKSGDIIPISEIINKLDRKITELKLNKSKITKQDLLTIMSQIGLCDYYNDINYIAHHYLGTPLRDWSSYEEVIFERFASFLQVYETIEKTRTSMINGQWLIKQFLLLEGCIDISDDDFKITKGQDPLREYERIFREACEKLGGKEERWEYCGEFVGDLEIDL